MALKREEAHLQVDQHQALKQMVQKFAKVGFGGAQTFIETGPDGYAALRRILIEIDETMLPRRITFEAGRGGQIDLYASNRRLLAVTAKGFEPETALNSPQKMAQHFAEVLRSFIAENKTIRLLRSQKTAPSKEAGVSVSTELLARALGLNDGWNDGDLVDALETLKEASIASVHAKYCLSFSCEQGPLPELDRLKTFWRDHTRVVAPINGTWGGHDVNRECSAFELDRQKYLVVIQINHDSALLALLPREHLNVLAKM